MATSKQASKATSKATTGDKAQPQGGRTVANPAQPARLGFAQAIAQWCTLYGWTKTDISDPSGEIVHINAPKVGSSAGGSVLMHTASGVLLRVSYLLTRDGNSTRMDAAYLWQPGATKGARVQTVYQVQATMANGGSAVAPVDTARQRGPLVTQQAAPVAAPAAPVDNAQPKATAPKGTSKRTPSKRTSKATQAA